MSEASAGVPGLLLHTGFDLKNARRINGVEENETCEKVDGAQAIEVDEADGFGVASLDGDFVDSV
jgi:hypothetical protein